MLVLLERGNCSRNALMIDKSQSDNRPAAGALAKKTSQIAEPFVTRRQLAAHLSVAKATIDQWHCSGKKIPCHRINKRVVRYRISEVLQWIKDGAK
jgi:hypothetical protein